MPLTIELPRTIDSALAADIEKESAFVSPHLRNLAVNSERNAVSLDVDDEQYWSEVQEKVNRFLEHMLKRTHNFDTRVFLENKREDDGPYTVDVFRELQRRKWVHDYGQGRVALIGPALELAKYIDMKADELYRRHFDAIGGMYPAFVDAELLKHSGYLDSHPNAISVVAHLLEDFDVIEEFRQSNTNGAQAVLPRVDHLHLPGTCLNPAACFPCYPVLAKQTIGGQAHTWQGRVFRYESRNTTGLERLWEFNVRELVFVGQQDYVIDSRQRVLPVVGQLASLVDLDLRVETASDPFFATVSAAKKFWQHTQEVKSEILLGIGEEDQGQRRELACGSINLHGTFFGDRFDIRSDAETSATTGCVGLGIERWVLAAFAQHGFDPERWRPEVREVIFG